MFVGLPEALAAAPWQTADQVVVRRSAAQRPTVYSGRVLDYFAGVLTLRLKSNGATRRFTAREIVRINTAQSESHTRGLAAFEAGRYAEAISAFQAATESESRNWVRRDLLAMTTRCALQTSRRTLAADAFVRLTNSDPQTHHLGLMPLAWREEPLNETETRQCVEWLTNASFSARLIAASRLLHLPDYRKRVTDTLEKIATSGKQPYVGLARVQQWRLTGPDQKLNPTQVRIRRHRLTSMPPDLRGGGWFLMGQAHRRRLEYDEATLAFLWVPLVYSQDRALAAEASLSAAQMLEKAGRLTESLTLYRETAQRYPDTRFGRSASQKLPNTTDRQEPTKPDHAR